MVGWFTREDRRNIDVIFAISFCAVILWHAQCAKFCYKRMAIESRTRRIGDCPGPIKRNSTSHIPAATPEQFFGLYRRIGIARVERWQSRIQRIKVLIN